jgi:hypothetical protein
MTEFEIIIAPAGGHRQADIFAAFWGDILLATSRTPSLTAPASSSGSVPSQTTCSSCATAAPAQQACALESVWRPSLQSTKQMPALGMFNGGIEPAQDPSGFAPR